VSLPALRWRSVPRQALAWRDWDGNFVVRNETSGSTHLLAPLAGRVLLALIARVDTATVDDLAAALATPGAACGPEWSSSIEGVLAEFERLGLARSEAH